MTARPTRSESGFTLIEVLISMGIVSLVMVPLLSWASLAFREEARNRQSLQDSGSISALMRRFPDDVAAATNVVTNVSCTGAADTAAVVRLTINGSPVVYRLDSAARTLTRQDCTSPDTSAQVLSGLDAAGVTVTCSPSTGADRCRQVTIGGTVAGSGRTFSVVGTRRLSGGPVGP